MIDDRCGAVMILDAGDDSGASITK